MYTGGTASLGPYILRKQGSDLFVPNDIANKIENMFPMEEGTLRTVVGPAALVDIGISVTGYRRPTSLPGVPALTSLPISFAYSNNMHGIFHCRLRNDERDILLLHTGTELWEFTGWKRGWEKLISENPRPGGIEASLQSTTRPEFPTQFVNTGTGIVIVPQNSRAYFYDGRIIAPLGFSRGPAPPRGLGPDSSKAKISGTGGGINNRGYCHDGTFFGDDRTNYKVGMTEGFGSCHVGTVATLTFDASAFDLSSTAKPVLNAGWLEKGEYRCRTQFVDVFGNVSPVSPPSSGVAFDFQASVIPTDAGTSAAEIVMVDKMLKQVAWAGITTGPEHCIGRVLYRSKDLVNSGSTDYFELPSNAAGVASAFATLPDNVTQLYPDNIPDSYLTRKVEEIDPVPEFKLCEVAFGRLWIANLKNDPGLIRPSKIARWGTFPADQEIAPDPAGGEITGLKRADRGLLVYTRRSVYLVVPSDDGKTFRSAPLSAEIGCYAPSSIVALPTGLVIWMGQDGFYMYDGSSLKYASAEIRKDFRRANLARLSQATAVFDTRSREYRCWVATDGSDTNNTCYIFDGQGWRVRSDTEAQAACSMKDHRQMTVIAGKVADDTGHNGVFVLDHSGNAEDSGLVELIDNREAMIETSWLSGPPSPERNTTHVVYLWLRETENSEVTIEVMRDWREKTLETTKAKTYSGEDVPPFYGSTTLGAKDAEFRERRPYWTRAAVYVPSNETFKIRIKGTGYWEFRGIQLSVTPRQRGGASTPP